MRIKKYEITQKELQEMLDYDSKTGIFRWKINLSKRAKIGEIAGSKFNDRIRIGVYKKLYEASRLAWFYVYGSLKDGCILKHINGNSEDNRIENLKWTKIGPEEKKVYIGKMKNTKKPYYVYVEYDGKRIVHFLNKKYKFFETKPAAEIYVEQLRKEYTNESMG